MKNYFSKILFFIFLSLLLFACKHHKDPYNPFLKMKKKVSEQVAEDHKKNAEKIKKDSKRRLRRNKRNAYSD